MMAASRIGLERHRGSRVIGGVVHLRQPSPDANRPIRATNSSSSPVGIACYQSREQCPFAPLTSYKGASEGELAGEPFPLVLIRLTLDLVALLQVSQELLLHLR